MMLDFNEKKNLFMLLDSDDIKNKENAVIIGMSNLMKPYEIADYAIMSGSFLAETCINDVAYSLGKYRILILCNDIPVFTGKSFELKKSPRHVRIFKKGETCKLEVIKSFDVGEHDFYTLLMTETIKMIDLFYQECKPEK